MSDGANDPPPSSPPTSTLTEVLLLLPGYQRELTYKHDDGSYSAFGKRDESGNTWWVEAAPPLPLVEAGRRCVSLSKLFASKRFQLQSHTPFDERRKQPATVGSSWHLQNNSLPARKY